MADEDGSSEAEWRRSPATSWANCVWLKLEHSFKSEWLNTPGHLSLSRSPSQGNLDVSGFDFALQHPWHKACRVRVSLKEQSNGCSETKREKKKGEQHWSSGPRSTGAKEEPRLLSLLRSCVFYRLTPVQRAKMDFPISFRKAYVTHSVRGTSPANRRQGWLGLKL